MSGVKVLVDDTLDNSTLAVATAEARGEAMDRDLATLTLNSIGDAVVSTDTKGRLTYLNGAAEAMTGLHSADVLGRPFTDVLRLVDGANRPCPDPMSMAMEQNKTVNLPPGSILIRPDGIEFSLEDSASPIP
jgi:PAS domain S-box-containing protein